MLQNQQAWDILGGWQAPNCENDGIKSVPLVVLRCILILQQLEALGRVKNKNMGVGRVQCVAQCTEDVQCTLYIVCIMNTVHIKCLSGQNLEKKLQFCPFFNAIAILPQVHIFAFQSILTKEEKVDFLLWCITSPIMCLVFIPTTSPHM